MLNSMMNAWRHCTLNTQLIDTSCYIWNASCFLNWLQHILTGFQICSVQHLFYLSHCLLISTSIYLKMVCHGIEIRNFHTIPHQFTFYISALIWHVFMLHFLLLCASLLLIFHIYQFQALCDLISINISAFIRISYYFMKLCVKPYLYLYNTYLNYNSLFCQQLS